MPTQKLLKHRGEDGFDRHARTVAEFYFQRRDALLRATGRHLSGLAEWTTFEAGMFLWIKLTGVGDTKALIETKAAQANVLFVPVLRFAGSSVGLRRASFSTALDEEMDAAMERLAELIRSEVANGAKQAA
ncbi:LOW QUALITY PROTEIN: hypothetical protein ACHAWF_002120 [Thalassiosira exigua]